MSANFMKLKSIAKSVQGVLRPTKPSEAYALVLLCVLIAGGAVKAVEAVLPDSNSWHERADQLCYKNGNAFLDAEKDLNGQIAITESTLVGLRAIRDDVPTSSVLLFNSMIDDKATILDLMRKKRAAGAARRSVDALSTKIDEARYGYSFSAQQLGMDICGQGTGDQ